MKEATDDSLVDRRAREVHIRDKDAKLVKKEGSMTESDE